MARKIGKWIKGNLMTLILVAAMLVGLCLVLYPSLSDWWNSMHASEAIAAYIEQVDDLSKEEMDSAIAAAKVYNQKLLTAESRFTFTEEEQAEYDSILDITGTGIMGYVNVPSVGINLPIYHGTDEAVLQIGAGHIEGTSFPVGGESTHSVISGHRGLPSAKLFTDIDQLKEGDIFTVSVLNQLATYQVDQIRIVLPEEMTDLAILPGEDYCTLQTCTPYGVNTHRLLVRGHRIENTSDVVTVNAEAQRIPSYVVILAVGIPMLFVFLIGVMLYYGLRGPKLTEEELMERFKKKK